VKNRKLWFIMRSQKSTQTMGQCRDKYVAERSRQMKKMASILSCFCLAALLGVGVWHSGTMSNEKEQAAPARWTAWMTSGFDMPTLPGWMIRRTKIHVWGGVNYETTI
jgi:hypothetical protein